MNPNTFAADLKAWTKRMGYTRAQAAEALGAPFTTFEGWCAGRQPAMEGMARRLMAMLEGARHRGAMLDRRGVRTGRL